MNEVALLPKKAPSIHSKQTGHLKQYQNKLAEKYLEIIGNLQTFAQKSSNNTKQLLENKMNEYQFGKQNLLLQQRQFLDSMGQNAMSFDELKNKLQSIGNEMIENSIKLRVESIEIYDSAFSQLQPRVNDSFKQCELFVNQLPAVLPMRLETVVKHLNESYISNKTSLIKALYQEEIDVRTIDADAKDEFDQRSDDWRINKFEVLIKNAKEQLDYKKSCEFDSIFQDFYQDEKKFILCYKKLLQNLLLITPPDNFSKESDFDPWWKEVQDMLCFHQNFINTFIQRIEDSINQSKSQNLELVENLEKELIPLKSENEVNIAMNEVIPMMKQCRKYSENFLNKLKRYWENRSNALQIAFNSIKDFMLPILNIYQDCLDKTNASNEKLNIDENDLRNNSEKLLNELEMKLTERKNEIQMLVTEEEIKHKVEECKQILQKIGGEYHKYYDAAIELYDSHLPEIMTIFEAKETEILTYLKLRKTTNPPEWLVNSARSSQRSSGGPQSVRKSKRPTSRAVKKRPTGKPKDGEKSEIFYFEIENGSQKFEESEELNIIPPIEDFIDEATLPPPTSKGGKNKSNRNSIQNRNNKSSLKNSSGKGSVRGSNSTMQSNQLLKNKSKLDDLDDVEVPDIILMDAVPRIDKDNKFIKAKLFTENQTQDIMNSINKIIENENIVINEQPKPTKNTKQPPKPKNVVIISEETNEEAAVPSEKDDSVPSILVYTPGNIELKEWKNWLRKAIVTEFEKNFATQMQNFGFDQEREALADELNERLRLHASRASSIELNIAQARLIKLDSRKVQLEKHFRKATLVFNKGLKSIEIEIDKNTASLLDEVNTLNLFIQELDNQKNSSTFQQLNQEFTIRVKSFSSSYLQQINKNKEEIETFITSFKSSNERFVKSLGGAEEVFSEDERKMCMEFFERMEVQIDQIVQALNDKQDEVKNELDQRVKSISDEFNLLYPHHRNDMIFVDAMQKVQAEAKAKLDTLIFKNKLSEQDVTRTIENVQQNRNSIDDPQKAIQKEFENLDSMRICILKRSKFLNILKSKISFDPIPFTLILGNPLTESEKMLTDPNLLPSSRKSGNKARNSATKTRPDSAKKPTAAKKAEQSNELLQTFQGQIDGIGNEILTKLGPTINEYYSSLKQRKSPITKPTLIPASANECIEKNKKAWEATMSIIPSIVDERCRAFRNQVVKASEIARASIPYIFSLYLQFYRNHTKESNAKIQANFTEDLAQVRKSRETNRKSLNPKLFDDNNTDELNSLIQTEDRERLNNMALIKRFNFNMLNNEFKEMQLFVSHIPLITKCLLQLFDAFLLSDDLVGSEDKNLPENHIENAQRLTLKEMLKEKQRRLENPVNDATRPFPQKMWGVLDVIMPPLAPFFMKYNEQIQAGEFNSSATESTLTLNSIVSSSTSQKKTPRRSAKKADTKKKDDSKNIELQLNEKLPIPTSLETPLQRGVIFERNNCYNDYEAELNERVNRFDQYINQLEQEDNAFYEHWKKCILMIKPNFKFPNDNA